MMTVDRITDEQCQSVIDLVANERHQLVVALHDQPTPPTAVRAARVRCAELWNELACESCTLRYMDSANHPPGMIFVGWGHGWQPCTSCGGSGLSRKGRSLKALSIIRGTLDSMGLKDWEARSFYELKVEIFLPYDVRCSVSHLQAFKDVTGAMDATVRPVMDMSNITPESVSLVIALEF